MSFGKNLQYLRRERDMTQEDLAERMEVSRQTVSKWESDASFPELEKVLLLCDLFACNMDVLLRGEVEHSRRDDSAGYERHMNRFTRMICAGVFLILFGVSLIPTLEALGAGEILPVMVFLALVSIAVALLVVGGLEHSGFVKRNPQVQPCYPPEVMEAFERKFPILIALPILLIFLGLILLIGGTALGPAGMTQEQWETLLCGGFLLMIAVAVPILVYAGMQKSKYDVEVYNREAAPTPEQQEREKTAGVWNGCIMMAATIAFLLMGFLWNLWHVAWVAFPVGGILCGMAALIIKRE